MDFFFIFNLTKKVRPYPGTTTRKWLSFRVSFTKSQFPKILAASSLPLSSLFWLKETNTKSSSMEVSNPNPSPSPSPSPRMPNMNSISSSTPVWPTVDGSLGLSEEESVAYARRFYQWGFFLLPLLWGVNCFYFWPVLRHSRSFPRIRHCLSLSLSFSLSDFVVSL